MDNAEESPEPVGPVKPASALPGDQPQQADSPSTAASPFGARVIAALAQGDPTLPLTAAGSPFGAVSSGPTPAAPSGTVADEQPSQPEIADGVLPASGPQFSLRDLLLATAGFAVFFGILNAIGIDALSTLVAFGSAVLGAALALGLILLVWRLAGSGPEATPFVTPPVKRCAACGKVIALAATRCYHCGADSP